MVYCIVKWSYENLPENIEGSTLNTAQDFCDLIDSHWKINPEFQWGVVLNEQGLTIFHRRKDA